MLVFASARLAGRGEGSDWGAVQAGTAWHQQPNQAGKAQRACLPLAAHSLTCPAAPPLTPTQGPAAEMLYSVSEAVGPGFVAGLLHKKAVEHKNPKVCGMSSSNWAPRCPHVCVCLCHACTRESRPAQPVVE